MNRRWLRPLEWAAALAVVVFIVRHIAANWSQVAEHSWRIDWLRLALASACVAVAYSGFVLLWRRLVRLLGGRISVVDAHRVWYLGNLGRYVPGKVLQLAGTAYLARSKGVRPVIAVSASIAGQLFLLGAGSLLAAGTLPGVLARLDERFRAIVLVVGLVLAILLLTPVFNHLYRLGLRVLGKEGYYTRLRLGTRVVLLVGNGLAWLAFATGFYLFVTATAELPAGLYGRILGICAVGYVLGWVVVFVPGGLGVREGVYALLLSLYLPGAVAAAVAVLSRLWLTAVELGLAAVLVGRYGVRDLRATGSNARGQSI